jgi:hypothetical protein
VGKHKKVFKVTRTRRQALAVREKKSQAVLAAIAKPYLSKKEEFHSGRSRWAPPPEELVEKISRSRWMKRNNSSYHNSLKNT